jgi:hypothetical protein
LLAVAALVAMADDEYHLREWGSRTAGKLVRVAPSTFGPPTAHLADSSPSAEVRSRCGRILGPWRDYVAATYVPSGIPVWPEIDIACWAGIADNFCHWHDAAKDDMPPGLATEGPWWCSYRRGTELYTRHMIRSGQWTPDTADAMLALAWKRELEYFAVRPEMERIVKTWRVWSGGYPGK